MSVLWQPCFLLILMLTTLYPQLDELSLKPRPSIDLTNNAQSPSHKVQRSTSNQKPRRPTDQSKTRCVHYAGCWMRVCALRLHLYPCHFPSLLQVCLCRLSILRVTVSTSLTTTGGKAQAAPLKFLQARLPQPTERKPRPRPPLVHVSFLLTVVELAVMTWHADFPFLCRTEQHPFNWYKSWEKLSRSWEIYSRCTEWQGQVQTWNS